MTNHNQSAHPEERARKADAEHNEVWIEQHLRSRSLSGGSVTMASEQIGSRGENKPCTIVSHHRSFGRGADSEGPGSRGKRSHCDHFSSNFSIIPVQVKYGEMRGAYGMSDVFCMRLDGLE